MAGPIARRPTGLLDLLLTQQQGKNPAELGEQLEPTIELIEFYALDRLTVTTQVTAVVGVGNNLNIEVPGNEVWRLLNVGIRFNWATVNQTFGIRVELRDVPGGGVSVLTDFGGTLSPSLATDQAGKGHQLPNPILIPPGATIRGDVTNVNLDAQPNISVTLSVLYHRLTT